MGIIKVFFIAIGLSMDAFSLAVLYGTLSFTRKKTTILSTTVGFFHFFMPILGSLVGLIVLEVLPVHPNTIVGAIFLVVSIQMLSSIKNDEEITDIKGIVPLLLFALTVSLDSFSVGIGLEYICDSKLFAATIFSILSFTFTFVGLNFGGKLNQKYGNISTLMGSIILFMLAIFHFFAP